METDQPAAARPGFVAESASRTSLDRMLSHDDAGGSSPSSCGSPVAKREKVVRMMSTAVSIAPKAVRGMSRMSGGGDSFLKGCFAGLGNLPRRNGRFRRMDSQIIGNDDGERDCIFELLNICLPCLKYRGNMTETESEAYMAQLQAMAWPMKLCVTLYNLIVAAIDPSAALRILWDMIMMLALLYVSVMVPFYVAFEVAPDRDAPPLAVSDKVIDMLFICDILLNFRFAYEDDRTKKVVQCHRKIAKNYLKTWFTIDLLSSIPIDWILGGNGTLGQTARLTKLAKFARILKITKLIRLVKAPTMLAGLETMLGRTTLKMSKILVICVFVAHIMACFFYFSAILPLGTDWKSKPNWRCDELGECEPGYERDVLDDYITALFWSFTTITTVGYGDVVPSNMYERIVAILCMVAGVAVFGYFMGAMSSMVQQMNMSKQKDREREEAMEAFLAYRDLPEQMSERIKAYYSFVWTRDLRQEEKKWLLGLSGGLRTEAVLYMYQDALKRIPFFHDKHPQFIADMVLHLRPETYGPCDIISRQGDPASCMYFVSRGTLNCCEQVSDEAAQDLLQVLGTDALDESGEISAEHSGRVRKSGESSATMERNARKKVLQTMSVHNIRGYKNKAKQLGGGVLKKGSIAQDDEEHLSDSLRNGTHVRDSKTMVYVIPDNCLYRTHLTRKSARPARAKKISISTFNLIQSEKTEREEEYSEYGAHLQDQSFEHLLALSRRAMEVHSDLEMIEAFQLLGGEAVPFSRIGVIRPGMYFGEYACLLGTRQSITVVAAEFCEVYALKRSALESILKDWPNVEEEFRNLVSASSKDSAHGNASAERRFANTKNLQSMVKKAAKTSLFANIVTEVAQHQSKEEPGSSAAPEATSRKPRPPRHSALGVRQASRRMSQPTNKRIHLPPNIQSKMKGAARLVKLKERRSTNEVSPSSLPGPVAATFGPMEEKPDTLPVADAEEPNSGNVPREQQTGTSTSADCSQSVDNNLAEHGSAAPGTRPLSSAETDSGKWARSSRHSLTELQSQQP